MNLPESLAVVPNIPWREQTDEQIAAERDYWKDKLAEAKGWGGAVGAAQEFMRACEAEIERRAKPGSRRRL